MMLTLDSVNTQINNVFASNNVLPDGPGEEAFWNAVEEVDFNNPTAAEELRVLSDQWMQLQGGAG